MELTTDLAKKIGTKLGVEFNKIPFKEFYRGIQVELEHRKTLGIKSTDGLEIGDWAKIARIAHDHLLERPDYYSKLDVMEKEPVTNESNADELFKSIKPRSTVTIKTPQGQLRKGRAVMFNNQYRSWVLNMGGAHGTPGIASPHNVVAVDGKKLIENVKREQIKEMVRQTLKEIHFPPKAIDLNKLPNADSFWGWSINDAADAAGLTRIPPPFKRISDLILWMNMAAQEWAKRKP